MSALLLPHTCQPSQMWPFKSVAEEWLLRLRCWRIISFCCLYESVEFQHCASEQRIKRTNSVPLLSKKPQAKPQILLSLIWQKCPQKSQARAGFLSSPNRVVFKYSVFVCSLNYAVIVPEQEILLPLKPSVWTFPNITEKEEKWGKVIPVSAKVSTDREITQVRLAARHIRASFPSAIPAW